MRSLVRSIIYAMGFACVGACVSDAEQHVAHHPVSLVPPYSELPRAPAGTSIEPGTKVVLDARQQEAVVAGVRSALGLALDGEWNGVSDSYPSGNGTQGGDFRFHFNVLPGDVNRSGLVQSSDALPIQAALLQSPGGALNSTCCSPLSLSRPAISAAGNS